MPGRLSGNWSLAALLTATLVWAGCATGSDAGRAPTGAAAPTPASTAAPTPTAASPQPSPQAAAPATPDGSAEAPCPVQQGVCAFAGQLERWLLNGEYDPIVAASTAEEWECPGPTPRGAGDAFPLCQGSTAGERRSGYQHARILSEGSVLSAGDYRELLRQHAALTNAGGSDGFGTGAFRLFGIGCPSETGAPDACAQQFIVAFSGIPAKQVGLTITPMRTLLLFYVHQAADGAPRIAMTVAGGAFPSDPHLAALRGGSAAVLTPREFAPFGVFHRWSRSGAATPGKAAG